ncbi:MAG: YqhA family protein [Halothiobacillaceae bacterium]|nr:MAG: YqhA family protein [Halothiobacillaceae bacterium]
MKMIEQFFEKLLWDLRLVVIVAVIVSAILSLAMFYVAAVDAYNTVAHLLHYADPALDTAQKVALRNQTVTHVVEVLDGFLLATILLIFALGLYELFISKIDAAHGAEGASNVLIINNLDDLKNRLAKVILLILVVKFFEYGINMSFKTPMDLLTFAGGIALIGLSLFLSHKAEDHGPILGGDKH